MEGDWERDVADVSLKAGTTALVQGDEWFYGPDGEHYRAAWGPIHFHKIDGGEAFVQVGRGRHAVLFPVSRVHSIGLWPAKPQDREIFDATRPHQPERNRQH